MPKAISHSELHGFIDTAIREIVPFSEMDFTPWIADVFPDFAIIEMDGGKWWQVPYTATEDADLTVSVEIADRTQWLEVESRHIWVEAKMKAMAVKRLFRTTVKAVENDEGEWLLDVLGAPFGGPFNGQDREGEHFSTKTNFMLDEIGKRPIFFYHGLGEDGLPTDPEVIGEELSYEEKADGIWFRVLLDKSKAICADLWGNAKQGLVNASSGAIQHLVRPLTREAIIDNDGHIDIWPIGELSLTDASKGIHPINPYAITLPVLKAHYKAAQLSLPEFKENKAPARGAGEKPPKETIMAKETAIKATPVTEKALTMPELVAYLEKRDKDREEAARIAGLQAKADELDAIKAEAAKAKGEPGDGKAQIKRLPHPAPEGAKAEVKVYGKYDSLTIPELGFAFDLIKSAGRLPSALLFRTLHAKAQKKIDSGEFDKNRIVRDEKGTILREFSPIIQAGAAKAVKAATPMMQADTPAVKADELMFSTQTSYGDEWVPPIWSAELWDLVRINAKVLSMFQQVEVPGESLTIPTLAGKTTLYKVAQTEDQASLTLAAVNATMTKAQTSNVTLTPVKGMAWLGMSEEFNEDSIIQNIPFLTQALALDVQEQIDEILISGDTDTTSANNSDTGNGAISTSWHLLIANGLRDYALENSKGSSRGSLTAEDFTVIMNFIGTNGAWALDPDKLFWLMDPKIYRKALLLGETLTADKAGDKIGTFANGRLQRIFGSDVLISDKYGLTDANGQIHNTPGNNTQGSFLLVRPDRWKVGFGRQVTVEVLARSELSAIADVRNILASFRMDFQTHSDGNGVGLGYNVTVT